MPRLYYLLVALTVGCARVQTTSRAEQIQMPELRADIERMVAVDQAVQLEIGQRQAAGHAVGPTDFARRDSVFSVNLERMRVILAHYGWPGRRLVGEEGSHGAWLLLQHADRDTALQRTALDLLTQAVSAGDAAGKDLAYLTDRVRIAEGRLQLYGTQLDYDSRGCASPKASENPAQLDTRRAAMGLEPISVYVQRVMATLGRADQCPAK